MSGLKLTRKQRLAGKIGAAAVIATLTGAPQQVVEMITGSQDFTSMALAGKSPPPPPPPPASPPAPLPEPLNADPNVHWFAAWGENNAPGSADFFPTPTNSPGALSPGGVANMKTQLNAVAGVKPLGIKVETPLSASDAASLFSYKYPNGTGTKAISFVFADFEQPGSATVISNVTSLVNQVRGSTWSKNAYVGQYGLWPMSVSLGHEDRMGRGPSTPPGPNASHHHNFGKPDYDGTKVNMANASLYPGQADFRNKATNDWANSNIRTGLFITPIGRSTDVQEVLDQYYGGTDTLGIGLTKHKNIPWVARFNNAGNTSLDTDQNSANGYRFVPGAPLNNGHVNLSGTQTANQMMGRGDFSSQIFHMRARGAYSVNLFHENQPGTGWGSVEGYTQSDSQQDVRDGWYGGGAPIGPGNVAGTALGPIAHANNIFSKTDNKRATMTLNPIIDGTSANGGMRSEQTGTLWSGVYSLSLKQLDILASNLDTSNHLIKFGTVDAYDVFCVKNGSGYTYQDNANVLSMSRNALVEAGMHRLLQFDLVTTRVYNSSTFTGSYKTKTIWLLNQNYLVFNNNNRNDVGIPEPTTFGILAAAGSIGMICRRHRSKKTA